VPEDRFRKAAKDGRTCVTIDQQHGLGGNEAMVHCLTAAKASNMPALARVAENDPRLGGIPANIVVSRA